MFELELAGCNEVTEAGLWSCLTPRIVSLSLADCINIADEAVGAVAQLLPSLYEFSLQVCYFHSYLLDAIEIRLRANKPHVDNCHNFHSKRHRPIMLLMQL